MHKAGRRTPLEWASLVRYFVKMIPIYMHTTLAFQRRNRGRRVIQLDPKRECSTMHIIYITTQADEVMHQQRKVGGAL